MDGNGRWATGRGLRGSPVTARASRRRAGIVPRPTRSGSGSSRSTPSRRENWSRPLDEVSMLMNLLERSVHAELPEFMARNARCASSARRGRSPWVFRRGIDHVVHETRNNTG